MHTTKDTNPKRGRQLWIHHNGDWSGNAVINILLDTGDPTLIAGAWTVDAAKLLGGRLNPEHVHGQLDSDLNALIPVDVLLRATALAVVTFCREALAPTLETALDRMHVAVLRS